MGFRRTLAEAWAPEHQDLRIQSTWRRCACARLPLEVFGELDVHSFRVKTYTRLCTAQRVGVSSIDGRTDLDKSGPRSGAFGGRSCPFLVRNTSFLRTKAPPQNLHTPIRAVLYLLLPILTRRMTYIAGFYRPVELLSHGIPGAFDQSPHGPPGGNPIPDPPGSNHGLSRCPEISPGLLGRPRQISRHRGMQVPLGRRAHLHRGARFRLCHRPRGSRPLPRPPRYEPSAARRGACCSSAGRIRAGRNVR